jgi:hypothetical protein
MEGNPWPGVAAYPSLNPLVPNPENDDTRWSLSIHTLDTKSNVRPRHYFRFG